MSAKHVCALILAVTAAGALWAKGAQSTGGGGSAAASRQETIIFAQGADPRGLDPAYVDDGESFAVLVNILEGLTKYDDHSAEVKPCLAESWDVSPDGLVYTFHLRRGVKFHDGTDFKSDAVVASIGRQLPPNDYSEMPYATFTFGFVDKLEAVDDYTVRFTLKQPYTPFLANLAMPPAAPIVSPAALRQGGGSVMENPVGTGQYKFVRWEKGVAVTLVRNDDYWDKANAANVKNLVIRIIPENSARAAAIMAGEIDVMNGLDAPDVETVKARGVKVYDADGMNTNYLAFNVTRPPFDNRNLREAVVRAINVPELVQALYLGYASPAYSVLPDFIPGYAKDVKPPAYDPEKAKAILAAEGQPNLTVSMIVYTNPRTYNSAGAKLAEAIQQYLAKVGITANITQYDWTTYKTKAAQGEGDIIFYGWGGDNGDADNFMNLLDDQDRSMNVSGYHNPEYHDTLVKAAATPNGPERNALYARLEQIVAEDLPWLTISHARLMAAHQASIPDFFIHPTQTIYFRFFHKN